MCPAIENLFGSCYDVNAWATGRKGQPLKLQLVSKKEIRLAGSIPGSARQRHWLDTAARRLGLKYRLIPDTGKPTGYEKNIESTRRQARQQAGVPGHQTGSFVLRALASGMRRVSVSGLRVVLAISGNLSENGIYRE
jgi:hypothetical protein